MKFIIFVLLILSFSGLANELKPDYECVSSINSDDIIKFENKAFEYGYDDSYSDKTINILANNILTELHFWKIWEPTAEISEYFYRDRGKGFGYDYFFSNYDGVVEIKYWNPETDGSILYRCIKINKK